MKNTRKKRVLDPTRPRQCSTESRASGSWLFLMVSVVVILFATLRPAEPEYGVGKLLCGWNGWDPFDAVLNILLFVPLGMALVFQGVNRWTALGICAGLSFSIEVAQFWIPGRDSDLGDIAANTLGGVMGIIFAGSKWSLPVQTSWLRMELMLRRPEPRLSNCLAVAAALTIMMAIWLTGYLSVPSFPHERYLVGSRILEPSTRPLRIGGDAVYGEHFHGMIDEVRIYNRALTPAEMLDDMKKPVSTSPPARGLVAAYGFDEGGGRMVYDSSGHGHSGSVEHANRVEQGKFHHALAFNGRNSMVSVSPASDLNFTDGMTLSAWVCPRPGQHGWRQIVKRETDAYYLMASSDAGSLKPAGGASFSGALCSLRSTDRLVPNQWVYLALTYDGSAFSLYRNGRLLARQALWYGGNLLAVSAGSLNLLAHGGRGLSSLGSRLSHGTPLNVTVEIPRLPPSGKLLPVVKLGDGGGNDVLTLSANATDLSLNVRTRAMNLGLYSPPIVFSHALSGASSGKAVSFEVWRERDRWQAKAGREVLTQPGLTIGEGWRFFCASEFVSAPVRTSLDYLWLAALVFPVGFWIRRQTAVPVVAILVVSFGILPQFSGLLPVSVADIGMIFLGLLAGFALRWKAEPRQEQGEIVFCR